MAGEEDVRGREKMQEINIERKARLERQRMRKEDFQKSMEKVSEDEKFLRRMEIAEIRENAWRWRGALTSHEEQTVSLEKRNNKEEKGKVRDKLERQKDEKEKEEKETKEKFLDEWKERERRKKRQKIAQEGWKKLMESIEGWEEIVLEEEREERKAEMKGEGEEQAERLLEVKNIVEEILEELKEMLYDNSKERAAPSPRDRCKELEKIRKELRRIEEQVEGGRGKISIKNESTEARIESKMKRTTRKCKPPKNIKGVEVQGENGNIMKIRKY